MIEPDEEWAAVYDRLYPYYVDIYKDLDKRLKSLRAEVSSLHSEFDIKRKGKIA